MKSIVYVIAFTFLSFLTAKAQMNFQHEYFTWKDTVKRMHPRGLKNTSDGGYLLTGFSGVSEISPGSKPFLLKTNSTGDTLWTHSFSAGTHNACFFSVDEDLSGNYIACGSIIDSVTAFDYGIFVVKVNSSGNIIWSNFYSLSNDSSYIEMAKSVKATSDGGCIIAGYHYNSGYNAFLLKLDNGGNTQWSRVFSGINSDLFFSVDQTSDGGYIASGETGSFDAGVNGTICLVRTDSNGDTLWTKNFKTASVSIGWMVTQTNDGGYAIAVSHYDTDVEMGLIKTNSSGNLSWAKTYGGNGYDLGYSVAEASNGGYVIAGQSLSFNDLNSGNYFLVRVNSTGQLVWAKEYGGNDVEEAYTVQKKNNGGYSIFGYSDSWIPTSSAYLVSTDSAGNTGCNEFTVTPTVGTLSLQAAAAPFSISSGVTKTPRSTTIIKGGTPGNSCGPTAGMNTLSNGAHFTFAPNPCRDYTRVTVDKEAGNTEIKIYNCLGELVKKQAGIPKGETTINTGELPGGIYFIALYENNMMLGGAKIIIE
jgi:hypothetical protein